MSRIILLDSTPLGLISNPRNSPENDACNQWLQRQLQAGALIAISEIADYEVPTAHDLKLDADCLIAAQADLLRADGHAVTVATSNVAHLALFVPAARWRDIS